MGGLRALGRIHVKRVVSNRLVLRVVGLWAALEQHCRDQLTIRIKLVNCVLVCGKVPRADLGHTQHGEEHRKEIFS